MSNTIKGYKKRHTTHQKQVKKLGIKPLKEFEGVVEKEGYFHARKHEDLICYVARHAELLHWCGYVQLEKRHCWFGKRYDELHEEFDINVHGGLTFSNYEIGTENQIRTIGFDTGHYGDKRIRRLDTEQRDKVASSDMLGNMGTYKDLEYVKNETTNLAKQAHKAGLLYAS